MLEQEQKQLKELLPSLVALNEKLKGVEITDQKMKDIQEQVKRIEGSVLDFGQQLSKISAPSKAKKTTMDENDQINLVKFFTSVLKAEKGGFNRENEIARIKDIHAQYSSKAMTEGTPADGGYLVPTLFSKMIWAVGKAKSVILSEAMTMPLTKGFVLPITRLSTYPSVAWENESATFDDTTPVLASSNLTAKKLGASVDISDELIEDEPVETMDEFGATTTADWLVNVFGEVMGTEIDNQGFNGTGSPITGILGATGTNLVQMGTGRGAFSDISDLDCSNLIASLSVRQLKGAKFYMSRQVLHYLRTLKASTSGVLQWGSMAEPDSATIFGYPVQVVENMPSTTAVGTKFVIFGNMKNFVIGSKGEMKVSLLRELKALSGTNVLLVKKRIAMVTALPSGFSCLRTNPYDS